MPRNAQTFRSKGGGRRFSPARFRELVNHILAELGPLNEQQLSNVLFKIDMEAYRKTGRSMTGATYLKAPDGVIVTNKGNPQRNLISGRVIF